jgi:glycosyltransferase involved in cell wall biosynthesis
METYPPPPQIAALPNMGPRRFWSVMIPTYNRATFLEKTLQSVLSQDPGPEEMQIEVVDDASTVDDPEPVVRRVGGGRVGFFRQSCRLGTAGAFNACVQRSIGQWVHILNSDDIVFPGFYQRFKSVLPERDDVGAAFCRCSIIDENDRWLWNHDLERSTPSVIPDFICRIATAQTIETPSIVVRRSVYEELGGYRTDLSYATDWEMWIRIAAHHPFWYEPEILAAWRDHRDSSSVSFMKSAANIADMRHCIEISRHLLPAGRANSIVGEAKERLSLEALDTALGALTCGDFSMARKQLREAMKCSVSSRVISALLVMAIRVAGGAVRRAYKAGKRRFAGTRS